MELGVHSRERHSIVTSPEDAPGNTGARRGLCPKTHTPSPQEHKTGPRKPPVPAATARRAPRAQPLAPVPRRTLPVPHWERVSTRCPGSCRQHRCLPPQDGPPAAAPSATARPQTLSPPLPVAAPQPVQGAFLQARGALPQLATAPSSLGKMPPGPGDPDAPEPAAGSERHAPGPPHGAACPARLGTPGQLGTRVPQPRYKQRVGEHPSGPRRSEGPFPAGERGRGHGDGGGLAAASPLRCNRGSVRVETGEDSFQLNLPGAPTEAN